LGTFCIFSSLCCFISLHGSLYLTFIWRVKLISLLLSRLYREVYSATQPFLYEQYRKAQIEKKLQEKRENRIGVVKKLPKVNKKLALKLLESRDRSSEKPPVLLLFIIYCCLLLYFYRKANFYTMNASNLFGMMPILRLMSKVKIIN
jgi:hypothetical protein